ncbi:MAG: PrsW family glutamic-type intramembrane protease [Bacteroidales bacterium]|nr:PrsW family glutamic-type intramembrane protease [Bacteroidales bacterium]
MNYYILSLAILPVIVLAWVVYRQDRFEREPIRMLLKAFFFGAAAILPAIVLESVLSAFTPQIPIVSGAYTGFVVAGCSEELCKLLMLRWAVWRSKEFDEYFDGIVYACFVSLGFACFENIAYVFQSDSYADALVTGSVRALLSVPGHFLFGVMMGYYFALAKFDQEHTSSHMLKAFLIPMLLHGTFDSLLMIPESMGSAGQIVGMGLFVVLIWFDVKMWRWGIRRIRHLQELSQQQDADRHNPFSGFTWNF